VLLHAHGASLLVDAGFGPRAIARRATASGIPLEPLAGIVVTHEHGDHARGALALAARAGCPLYASRGTLRALGGAGPQARHLAPVGASIEVGPFTVHAARTAHDAVEPVAVCVTDPAGHRVGVAWDLGRPTAAVRHLLRDVQALVVEANHDELLLQTGPYPASVRQRIGGSTGHLSNRLAAELAAACWSPELELVILAHLSEQCNDAVTARRLVGRALRARGFRGRLLHAGQREPLPAVTLRSMDQLRLALPESRPAPTSPPPTPTPIPGPSG
jgi:phosphoribosyl 1,2-cyclic phosphodiesterase